LRAGPLADSIAEKEEERIRDFVCCDATKLRLCNLD
jgi:hypothetical protein